MAPASVRARAAELAVLLAVFLTPLLFYLGTRDQFELPKLILLTFLASFLLVFYRSKDGGTGMDPVLAALLLLLTVQGVCSLPGTSLSWRVSLIGDYENFFGWTTSLTFLVWFLCLRRVLTPRTIEKALFFNSIAALLSSLYALGQRFGFDFIQWNPDSINPSREFASMGNPNFLGAYLAMSFPLFLHRFWETRGTQPAASRLLSTFFFGAVGLSLLFLGTGQGLAILGLPLSGFPLTPCRLAGFALLSLALVRWFLNPGSLPLVLGSILLLWGILSTGSRGGFLALLAGTGTWTLLALKAGTLSLSWPRVPRTWLAGGALVLAGSVVYGRSFLGRLLDSLLHAGESLEASRLHIWRPALRMIETDPLLGTGLDTFKTAFPSYSGVEFGRIDGIFVSSRTAHNELLQTAATTGLLGLGAYLLLLGAFLYAARGAWKVEASRGLLTALLACAAAYHVQNLFSFGVAALNLIWTFLLASVTLLDRRTPSLGPAPWPILHRFGKFLTLLLALLLALFALRRIAADSAFGMANAFSEALRRPQLPGTVDRLALSDLGLSHHRRSADLMPLEVKYRLYLGQAMEQRAPLDQPQAQAWLQKAGACYGQATAMNPANAYYWNNEGRIQTSLSLWDNSALEKAGRAYEKAAQLAPSSPLFHVQWSLALERNGETVKALSVLDRSFGLDPDLTAKVLVQTAVTDFDEGRKKKAFERLSLAAKGHPKGPEAHYVRGRLLLFEGRKKEAGLEFRKTKDLGPTQEKNPSIQDLDRYLAETQE